MQSGTEELYRTYAPETPIGTLELEYFAALYSEIATSRLNAPAQPWTDALKREYPSVRKVEDPIVALILAACAICQECDYLSIRPSLNVKVIKSARRKFDSDVTSALRKLSPYVKAADLKSIRLLTKNYDRKLVGWHRWAQKRDGSSAAKASAAGRPSHHYSHIVPVLADLFVSYAGFSNKQAAENILRLLKAFLLLNKKSRVTVRSIQVSLSTPPRQKRA